MLQLLSWSCRPTVTAPFVPSANTPYVPSAQTSHSPLSHNSPHLSHLTRSASTLSPLHLSPHLSPYSLVVESLDLPAPSKPSTDVTPTLPVRTACTAAIPQAVGLPTSQGKPSVQNPVRRPITFATIASLAAWMSRPPGSSCPVPITSPTSTTTAKATTKTKTSKHHKHKRAGGSTNGNKVYNLYREITHILDFCLSLGQRPRNLREK